MTCTGGRDSVNYQWILTRAPPVISDVRLANSSASDPKRDGLSARLVDSSMAGHDLGSAGK